MSGSEVRVDHQDVWPKNEPIMEGGRASFTPPDFYTECVASFQQQVKIENAAQCDNYSQSEHSILHS